MLVPGFLLRFEKMAEGCKKNLEILKLAQVQGLEPPKHHFEDRTYKTVRWGSLAMLQAHLSFLSFHPLFL